MGATGIDLERFARLMGLVIRGTFDARVLSTYCVSFAASGVVNDLGCIVVFRICGGDFTVNATEISALLLAHVRGTEDTAALQAMLGKQNTYTYRQLFEVRARR